MSDIIALRKFGGETPQLPPHMLPEWGAQEALFCDFTHGSLAPLKQGFLLQTMSNTVKTIYTEDGINFYTWPTDTYALKSPVLKDTFSRVYYLESGVLRATTSAGMLYNGGEPTVSWKVGVPRPTVAPALVLVDHGGLRDYPDATFTIDVWLESNSVRYQEGTVTYTTVTALRAYTFSAPTPSGGTPADAVVRCTFKAIDGLGNAFMTATLGAGDTDVRSTALPGGITFSLTQSYSTVYRLELLWGVSETRAYVYTTFNTWLEESPPSPASVVSVTYLQDVQVTLTAADFSGGYRPLSTYRTYRTIGASPSYLRIHDTADLVYIDTSYKGSDVLGALETLNYEDVPPYLDAMVRLPNGSLAGFHGNTLYISEVYRPHTWQYQQTFNKSVRGMSVAPGGLVLTTAEFCYLVAGVDPASMQPIDLNVPQAGVSQKSMTKLVGENVFASNDGFVSVSGAQANMAQSQALFARDDWRGRYGSILTDASMRFAYADGALIMTSSTNALGFVIRTDESVGGQFTQFNTRMDSMFQLPVTDTLYYSVGSDVFEFRAGDLYTYSWWSRDYIWNDPINMGAGYIRCSSPVVLSVYMDGVLWQTKTVSTGYFRIKSGRKGLRWSVKLQGTGTVEEFYLARTFQELKSV